MLTPMVIKVQTLLQWEVSQTASGSYVAACQALGLASQGNDKLDLWMNIQESIQLVMNDLLRCGELDSFLRSKGWTAAAIPVNHAQDGPVPFEVPMELVAARNANRDSTRTSYQ